MNRIARKFSLFPKIPQKKLNDLQESKEEQDLPLKLPPKQKLGKVYKSLKPIQSASLLVSLALAVITPLAATWLQSSKFNPESKAYQSNKPQVTSLAVVDAHLNQRRQHLNPQRYTLEAVTLPKKLTFEAITNSSTKSVRFWVNGTPIRIDNNYPFTLAGDVNGDYAAWNIPTHQFTLSAIAYSEENAHGIASNTFKTEIQIIDPTITEQTSLIGDCNNDSLRDAFDLNALSLEIYDGDGDDATNAINGAHLGSANCDANQDQLITIEDNQCLQSLILGEDCQN